MIKLTKSKLRKMIIKEYKALHEATRSTLPQAVTVGDVNTPEDIAIQFQNIYTQIAQLQTAIDNLQGPSS